MKVALVGAELEENLGLRYIHASLVNAGHEARIFNFHSPEMVEPVVSRVLRYGPQLVGLSMVFTGRAREFVRLAETLRAAGYRGHLTAGGHFASFHAEELLRDFPAVNSIVHGEGEEAIVDLAGHLNAPELVAGISYRGADGVICRTSPRPNPADLDSRPWPTRPDQFCEYLGMPIANMLSGRGCHANCNFCSISAWYRQNPGRRFRQRRVESIADEMADLYHRRGVRIFNFHDDNFFLPDREANLRRFAALKSELVARDVGRIAVQVKARPDSINREVVGLLREIGLFRVFLGVETNAVAGLKTLGRGTSRKQNHAALRLLREFGIHTTFNLLMFDPQSTLEDLRSNIAFMRRHAAFPLNFGRTEVYSGTPLMERLREEGRLIGDYFGYSYEIADPRAQRAFELFRDVFIARNFTDRGMNNQAMRLDYYYHVLRHFFPRRVTDELWTRVKTAIGDLNRNSAELLDEICAHAERTNDSNTRRRERLARSLAERRSDFDEVIRRRFEALIDEIADRAAGRQSPTRKRAAQVASAAAAALVISVLGCSNRSGNSGRQPVDTVVVRNIEPSQALLVEKQIESEYGDTLRSIASRNQIQNVQVRIFLELDERGYVRTFQISAPKMQKRKALLDELGREVQKWRFPMIQKAGSCLVTIQMPPQRPLDWHICEFMMTPMNPSQ